MSQTSTDHALRARMAEHALSLYEDPIFKAHLKKVDKARMKTLLGAVLRAGSFEEIEEVVRDQAGRGPDPRRSDDMWSPELVARLLKIMREAADMEHNDRQKARAAAEQLSLVARIHGVTWVEPDPGRGDDDD